MVTDLWRYHYFASQLQPHFHFPIKSLSWHDLCSIDVKTCHSILLLEGKINVTKIMPPSLLTLGSSRSQLKCLRCTFVRHVYIFKTVRNDSVGTHGPLAFLAIAPQMWVSLFIPVRRKTGGNVQNSNYFQERLRTNAVNRQNGGRDWVPLTLF